MNEMDTRFANQYNIQWFPGHMTKTLRMMEQEIQHVDASLVLLDARIPLSSLNPEIERITDRKPKLYALNKADLADPAVTEEWIRYFHAADAGCVAISAKQKGGANAVKAAIEKELPGFPIVLHGSSSVPQEYVKIINTHGGALKDAVGIPEEQLRKAAKSAVCKINIDSDSRLAMTAAIREVFATKPAEFDPRKYLGPARDELKKLYMHKCESVLGSAGKA